MKYYYKAIVFVVLLSLGSCKDQLNEEVFSFYTQENFLVNETELKSQALGLYDFQPNSVFEDQMYKIVTMPSKYYASRNRGLSSNAVIYGLGAEDRSYNFTWNIIFRVVGRANTIIKYADNAALSTSQEVIDQYKAEAHFFRAYCYFHLVRIWGNVPLITEPIESNSSDAINNRNSTLPEIYNTIISDLKFAGDNLPLLGWENLPKGRVRAATAKQLLGLVYLTMAGKPLEATENYQNAVDVLEEIIQNEEDYGVGLLSNWIDNFNLDNKINDEKLFALGSTNVPGYGSVLPFRITPQGQVGYAVNGSYAYTVSYELYQLFEENDKRKNDGFLFSYTKANGNIVAYNPNRDNGATYGGRNGLSHLKYTDGGGIAPVAHSNQTFYMRYVESFLILAEAYNELDNTEKALQNLNRVRSRVNASEITETDKDILRGIIRDERRRELFHEFTELYDMRRWGTVRENFENHPLRKRWNPSSVWQDRFEISPIPIAEISRNTNIKQNSDW